MKPKEIMSNMTIENKQFRRRKIEFPSRMFQSASQQGALIQSNQESIQ